MGEVTKDLNPQGNDGGPQSRMEGLLAVAPEARSSEWVETFCRELVGSRVHLVSDRARYGPDGFPYLMVRTGGTEPMGRLLPWLAKKGIGLVVNPEKGTPDMLFTYGMVWHFIEFGFFFRYHEVNKAPSAPGPLEGMQSIRCGQPSESYLPSGVRLILKQFLADQGILSPRIVMVSWDQGQSYDLTFSAESVGALPGEAQQELLEALAWFLPPHYGVAILSERGMPSFFAL